MLRIILRFQGISEMMLIAHSRRHLRDEGP